MPIAPAELEAVVTELARRPGHEKVRTLLHRILTGALDARSEQIAFERPLPEVNGRVDALLGRTLFEIKADLRREGTAAEAQLARYLPEREAATGQRYVGLATDGARFAAYEMREGALVPLTAHEVRPAESRALLAWLEGVIAVRDWLPADAVGITNELGRRSVAFARTHGLLRDAWAAVAADPEAALKRQLWERHLGFVYGKAVGGDDLWLQHTYLVILAKAIAAGAMRTHGRSPQDLLDGRAFREAGVHGAVEEDFFGWVLQAPDGPAIVASLADHAARFDLGSVDVDLLKVLYESLIDPEQRHDLGEYYTPDWLARKVVRRALDRPAEQTCLDPACGSGSFLFHAVRLKREALAAAGAPADAVAARCCAAVTGFDVHPVAVIFARVTYLLALGEALLTRGGDISLPVYLGDALQWNVRRDAVEQDLVIEVPPPGARRTGGSVLRFPLGLCADPGLFDRVVGAMHDASEAGRDADAFLRGIAGFPVPGEQHGTLRATYVTYDRLRRAGRDHVWGFIARNLSRPVALSDGARVDVVLGNPPWLSYRFMSAGMQARFRETARRLGVWVGADEARLVTQSDLAGLFFVRCAELYAKPARAVRAEGGGRLAMVLPLAVLSRGQYRAFRTGAWTGIGVAFTEAWVLDNQAVAPLFRVPTCALFATVAAAPRPTPERATHFAGRLPCKDAPEELADRALRLTEGPAPRAVGFAAQSPYRNRFRQGATLVPRMLCLVERRDAGRLGANQAAPAVQSRRSNLEDPRYRGLPSLHGSVERDFLRPVYLGVSIAPFRMLQPFEGVVPVDAEGTVLDARQAGNRGRARLAAWMERAEAVWDRTSAGKMGLSARWNFHNGLGNQFPVASLRVAFAASGTRPAAVILRERSGVVEHALYWCAVAGEAEGHFLLGILNSEAARLRIMNMQARGEQGARHFDKLMFTLPIPLFDARDPLHADLAAAAAAAEALAAAVPLAADMPFQRARGAIRTALRESGLAERIDALVADLLGPDPFVEAGAEQGAVAEVLEGAEP